MGQFAWELRQCLAELDAPVDDADRTLITPRAVISESPPRRVRARRSRTPAYILVALLAVAAIVAGALELSGSKGHKGTSGNAGSGGGDAASVTLSGVGDYTTSGHPDSHANTASSATDGNPSSYWYTQHYATPTFGGLLTGLGLVLDAGKPVKLDTLTLTSSTPGFTAQILAGNSQSGGFAPDSATQTTSSTTTFTLSGKTARYYVVWITKLPPGNSAKIEEVKTR